jgi:site-specific DNA-cytosine methylase
MKILVACEYSGRVRDAFTAKGHLAYSCDLLDSLTSGYHYTGNIFRVLDKIDKEWDMIIAHPPCTYLSLSGNRWYANSEKRKEAIDFVERIWYNNTHKICIENPRGVLGTQSSLGKRTQEINPWEFGESYHKPTCLWLKNLPKLVPTNIVDKGEFVIHGGKKIAKWYSNREFSRDLTFQGIANAMAEQWG